MAKEFFINTKTGSKDSSGTDANIYIQLHGANGKSSYFEDLDNPGIDDFMRGAVDTFEISTNQDIDKVVAITLKNDNSENHPGWFCEWVEIVHGDGNSTRFPVYKWLDSSSGLIKSFNEYTEEKAAKLHKKHPKAKVHA